MKYLKLYEGTSNQKTTLVIFGLPGSGKSKLAEEIKRQEPEMDWQLYDDFSLRKAKETMGQENQIISDGMVMLNPESSRRELQQQAKLNGSLIRYIYFKNSPDQCIINAKLRARSPEVKSHQRIDIDGSLLKQIKQLSIGYQIPKGETPIDVWNSDRES
jgi:predicted kinase